MVTFFFCFAFIFACSRSCKPTLRRRFPAQISFPALLIIRPRFVCVCLYIYEQMCVCYRAGVATEQHKYTVASVAVSTLGHMYISRYIYIYFFLIVTLMFLFMRDLLRSGDKCGAFCPADAECTRNNSATLNMVLGASSPDVNAKCNNMPSRQDPNPHTQTHYYFCRYKFCK